MDEENKLKKVLFNEISFLIAILAVAFGIFNYFQTPKTDIALIQSELINLKDNHIHTLEIKADQNSTEHIEMIKQLQKIQTTLDIKLK